MPDIPVGEGTPQGTARVLSAVLQTLIAEEIGGDTSTAFMQEFRDELVVAAAAGPAAVVRLHQELFLEMSAALYSLAKYTAQKTDEDPRTVLERLIRTYRKAVAADV